MSDFVEYLYEVFSPLGTIKARKIFGGYGIYHDDLMFGLVADDIWYLKADAENSSFFTDVGLQAFEYAKQGKIHQLSYYTAPEALFDDSDLATIWARCSLAAALRTKIKNARKWKPTPPKSN